MLFYRITATITDNSGIPDSRQREEYQDYASTFSGLNEMFYQKYKKQYYLFVSRVTPKNITIGAILKGDKDIEAMLEKYLGFVNIEVSDTTIEEITVKSLIALSTASRTPCLVIPSFCAISERERSSL